jgi:hypothetical protein
MEMLIGEVMLTGPSPITMECCHNFIVLCVICLKENSFYIPISIEAGLCEATRSEAGMPVLSPSASLGTCGSAEGPPTVRLRREAAW